MEAKKIKLLSAVIIAAAFVVGCSHSSNNNNPNPYGWWGSQFSNGMMGYNGYTSAYEGMGAATTGQAMIILDFAANTSTGYISGGGASYIMGELQVVNPIQCMGNSGVYLPPGVYQLSPPTPNTSNGSFDGSQGLSITFVANGPTQAVVQVPFVDIFSDAPMCGMNGLSGEFNVAQVAGYSCISQDIYFTSQSMAGYSCQ